MRWAPILAVVVIFASPSGCLTETTPTGANTEPAAPSSQTLPPRPDTQTPESARCEREWRNDEFGFGVNPPDGADGPYGNPENVTKLFWAEWIDQDGRTYAVTVGSVPGFTLPDYVQLNRDIYQAAGGTLLEDRAVAFTSGQIGWTLTASFPLGTSIDVFSVRSGYLFNAGVFDVAGVTSSELGVIADFLASLCVDP